MNELFAIIEPVGTLALAIYVIERGLRQLDTMQKTHDAEKHGLMSFHQDSIKTLISILERKCLDEDEKTKLG